MALDRTILLYNTHHTMLHSTTPDYIASYCTIYAPQLTMLQAITPRYIAQHITTILLHITPHLTIYISLYFSFSQIVQVTTLRRAIITCMEIAIPLTTWIIRQGNWQAQIHKSELQSETAKEKSNPPKY